MYQESSNKAEIEKDLLESVQNSTSNKIAFTVLCADSVKLFLKPIY